MPASTDSPEADRGLAALLAASGGRPIIQIVLDPENDQTSIRSAGLDGAEIPRFLLSLGRALTGEPAEPREESGPGRRGGAHG
jgi:hypothetical protein